MWIQTFDGDLVNGEFVERIYQHYINKDGKKDYMSVGNATHVQLYAVIGERNVLLDDSSVLGSLVTDDDVQSYIENRLEFYMKQLNWQYQ